MALTDAQLQGMAAQALNMAKRDLERGELNFLLASWHESDVPPLHRMTKVEALIIQRLGKGWLDSGRTKDIGFDILRLAVNLMPPDAVVFVTVANMFKPTAKLHALPPEQQIALIGKDSTHDQHHQAVKDGLMDVCESLVAIAQTPERVCHYLQEFEHGQFVGKPEAHFFPQEGFGGRLKMFGESEERGKDE